MIGDGRLHTAPHARPEWFLSECSHAKRVSIPLKLKESEGGRAKNQELNYFSTEESSTRATSEEKDDAQPEVVVSVTRALAAVSHASRCSHHANSFISDLSA